VALLRRSHFLCRVTGSDVSAQCRSPNSKFGKLFFLTSTFAVTKVSSAYRFLSPHKSVDHAVSGVALECTTRGYIGNTSILEPVTSGPHKPYAV
jgi:hypothetical protein